MRTRLFLLFLFFASILLFPLWRKPVGRIIAPQFDSPLAYRPQNEGAQAFVMSGVDLLQTKGTANDFRITARRVLSENQDELLEMENVQTAFFSGDGGVAFTASSEKGMYKPQEQILIVSGNVLVTGSKDNFEVRAESIRYAVRENVFETESAVTLQGRGILAQGEGIRYDTKAGILGMGGEAGRISTTFHPQPK